MRLVPLRYLSHGCLAKGQGLHMFTCCELFCPSFALFINDSFPFLFFNVNAEDKNCLIGGGSSSRNA